MFNQVGYFLVFMLLVLGWCGQATRILSWQMASWKDQVIKALVGEANYCKNLINWNCLNKSRERSKQDVYKSFYDHACAYFPQLSICNITVES